MRENYRSEAINRDDLDPDPTREFQKWFALAKRAQGFDANAMVLGTASKEGKPSTRCVLLKHCDEKGLVFFTNYNSKKAIQISENCFASATFYWREIARQISIEGSIEKLSRSDSESYFATRPRNSQIASWASMQDTPLSSREELEEKYRDFEALYEGEEVPCPDYWGGYIIKPQLFDFWAGKEHRLHDRFQYRLEKGGWVVTRVSP